MAMEENIRKQGIKRKRDHHSNAEDIASKLRGKLHHGLKEVKKATKKTKAFETQRIVKKLKDARKAGDESNIKHLEAQLECLKHIDLDDIAVRSLRSKIKKDTLLSKNPDCQEAVSSELSTFSPKESTSKYSERALVESRMLSSKILSSEVADVINSLRLVLGAGKQETPSLLGDHNDTGDLQESEEEEQKTTLKVKKAPQSGQKTQSERSLSEADAGEDGMNEDDEEGDEWDNDETAWAGFDGETDESGHSGAAESLESGSVHSRDDDEDEKSSASDSPHPLPHSHSPSLLQPSSPKRSRPTTFSSTSPATSKPKIGKAGESAFLPSLAVGFISGSDSEWSESEVRIADVSVKKNRRGQRARKAIWEKKYGRNANHLKKLRGESIDDVRGPRNAKVTKVRTTHGQSEGRGRGTSTERAASRGGHHAGGNINSRGSIVRGRGRPPARTSEGEAAPHHKARTKNPKSSHHPTEANRYNRNDDLHSKQHASQAAGGAADGNYGNYGNSTLSNVRPQKDDDAIKNDNKPLHPSWEAKRRLKEKESPAIVPPTGTRIKFT